MAQLKSNSFVKTVFHRYPWFCEFGWLVACMLTISLFSALQLPAAAERGKCS